MATLFAIECRNHGKAVVLAVARRSFRDLIGPDNFFSDLECAVNLLISPVEYERRAEVGLTVDRSSEILRDLGFDRLPVRINGKMALHQAIEESHAIGQRLNLEQMRIFGRHMRGLES